MVPGTATPSPSQRNHKTFWNANSRKPEVWLGLGRFGRPWVSSCGIIKHEQSGQEVSVWPSTACKCWVVGCFLSCQSLFDERCLQLSTEILQWPGWPTQAYSCQRSLCLSSCVHWSLTRSICCHSFRALVNLIKSHSHLVEIDPILLRSCLYLIPFDELLECNVKLNIELLDMLYVFLHKAPLDISFITVRVCGNTLKVNVFWVIVNWFKSLTFFFFFFRNYLIFCHIYKKNSLRKSTGNLLYWKCNLCFNYCF